MAKTPVNHRKPWTGNDIKDLQKLAGKTPTRVIGIKIGRTECAIYTEAQKHNISLKPTNQPPYGSQKKRKG